MILGLRTAVYPARDLAKAKAWYRLMLGRDPYFDAEYYVGFEVGGFELGLIPEGDSVEVYWGVADIAAELERLRGYGASVLEEIKEVGGDIKVAVVADPSGNRFGLIENPHFVLTDVR